MQSSCQIVTINTFYRLDALPVAQPTVSKALTGIRLILIATVIVVIILPIIIKSCLRHVLASNN